MQRGSHSPDHVIPDKDREHENRQLEYKRRPDRFRRRRLLHQLLGQHIEATRERDGLAGSLAGPLGQGDGVRHPLAPVSSLLLELPPWPAPRAPGSPPHHSLSTASP